MAKLDDLLKTAGTSISQSASFRPAPAAMPTLATTSRLTDTRREGVDRSKEFWLVPLDRIERDPNQPREENFDRDEDDPDKIDPDFQKLMDSMDRYGLFNPPTVILSEETGRYRVETGERRVRAAKALGWEKIEVRIKGFSPDPGDTLVIQMAENLARKNLKPLEMARAFRTLLTVKYENLAELGKGVGCSPALISQTLKLLELPESIQAKVNAKELDANSAYHVSKIKDPVEQEKVAEQIVSQGLSRDATVELVGQVKALEKPKEDKPKAKGGKGRGATSKPKVKLPTERTIRTTTGLKIVATARKGFDGTMLEQALEEALATARAEIRPQGVSWPLSRPVDPQVGQGGGDRAR
jgi:ParB family chromosome partitioning protein